MSGKVRDCAWRVKPAIARSWRACQAIHIDAQGAGATQQVGEHARRGAGGEHVVDQRQMSAGDLGLQFQAEGLTQIALARCGIQPLLCGCIDAALEPFMLHRQLQAGTQPVGEHLCLIEAASSLALAGQRHRQ